MEIARFKESGNLAAFFRDLRIWKFYTIKKAPNDLNDFFPFVKWEVLKPWRVEERVRIATAGDGFLLYITRYGKKNHPTKLTKCGMCEFRSARYVHNDGFYIYFVIEDSHHQFSLKKAREFLGVEELKGFWRKWYDLFYKKKQGEKNA